MKKFKDPKESSQRFFDNVKFLKEKLGPILFQLPPGWTLNLERFENFLKELSGKHRYVFEFRNNTWYTEDVLGLLRKYNCAFCIYELAGHLSPIEVTADFVYIRLHGPGEKYQGSYTQTQLRFWAERCIEWQRGGLNVFAYFDNDQNGYAAFNALTLKEIIKTMDV